MSAQRFRLELADGRVVTGAVHGSGGLIAGPAGITRLTLAVDRAERGRRLDLYEPRPGGVRVYPDYGAAGSGEPVDVPLAGARVSEVAS